MLCLALYGPTTSARRSTSPIRSRYPPAIRCGERRTCSSLHISPAPSPVGNPERIDSPANRSAGTPRASHCSASGRGISPPVADLVIEVSGQKANKTGREILEASMTIAVVGASRDPGKAGGSVPAGLQRRGFRIIPINPFADELFGERGARDCAPGGRRWRPSTVAAARHPLCRSAANRRGGRPGLRRERVHSRGQLSLSDPQADSRLTREAAEWFWPRLSARLVNLDAWLAVARADCSETAASNAS